MMRGPRDARCRADSSGRRDSRSEEHTSELQSHLNLVCRLLLEKKKKTNNDKTQWHQVKEFLIVTRQDSNREVRTCDLPTPAQIGHVSRSSTPSEDETGALCMSI